MWKYRPRMWTMHNFSKFTDKLIRLCDGIYVPIIAVRSFISSRIHIHISNDSFSFNVHKMYESHCFLLILLRIARFWPTNILCLSHKKICRLLIRSHSLTHSFALFLQKLLRFNTPLYCRLRIHLLPCAMYLYIMLNTPIVLLQKHCVHLTLGTIRISARHCRYVCSVHCTIYYACHTHYTCGYISMYCIVYSVFWVRR